MEINFTYPWLLIFIPFIFVIFFILWKRENEKTLDMIKFSNEERPIGVQIFGEDPITVSKSAAYIYKVFKLSFAEANELLIKKLPLLSLYNGISNKQTPSKFRFFTLIIAIEWQLKYNLKKQ